MGAGFIFAIPLPKAEAQEFQIIGRNKFGYLCLLSIDLEFESLFDETSCAFQYSFRTAFTVTHNHHIVRIAHKSQPSAFEQLVKFIEQYVG